MLRIALTAALAVFATLAAPAAFAAETEGNVTLFQGDSSSSFTPYSSIGSIDTGDLGTDGTEEIIVGAGKGLPPYVGVFRQDGSKVGEFLAYAEGFTGGVNVAACDVEGDGTMEIVTGARFGGGPHIRIFDNMGKLKYSGFFAYDESFRGGVNVDCDNVDGRGGADIVTGAGLTGGPHLKVLSYNGELISEIFDGSATENTGAFVRVEDGIIYTARVGVGESGIRAYAMRDSDVVFVGSSSELRDTFFTSRNIDHGTVTANVASELFRDTSPHYILVDVSEQRLYAYENGIQVNTFLISSGKYGWDTPIGKTSVTAKLPVHLYSGADYYLPNVKWNLRFRPHYYIHSAYWHNNFGKRMSHGCVNTSIPDAKWIYHWADVGTPVEVQN